MPVNSRSIWWDYFYKGKHKFANDQTHWKAFCQRCVDAMVREMMACEVEQAYTTQRTYQPRSELNIREQGESLNSM